MGWGGGGSLRGVEVEKGREETDEDKEGEKKRKGKTQTDKQNVNTNCKRPVQNLASFSPQQKAALPEPIQ